MHRKIVGLSPTELENLSFDLLQKLGMKNLVWRTPGRDGGRDLQGEFFVEDISGFTNCQTWYIDCKRYKKSVSWPTVWEKISFAESNSADILLIITTSSLSPQAVDEVNKWNNKKNGLVIRFWNSVDLETHLNLYPEIQIKYGLSNNPDNSKALAILPLTRILLKFSNSAQSCHVFENGKKETKLNVVYSISELIASRLAELDRNENISVSKFTVSEDSFEWLKGGSVIERLGLDKYAFRALSSYLYAIGSEEELNILKINNNVASIELSINVSLNVQEDLIDISTLSNIQISFKENRVELARSNI